MDELIELVSKKTGIPESTAKQAVEVVMGYLKDNLPEPLGSQIEGILSGSGELDLGGLAAGLEGLLGKK
jgi:nucleoid DNA-binding protein